MVTILQLISTFQVKTDTKWLVRLLARIDRAQCRLAVAAFYDDGPARAMFEALDIPCYCLDARRVVSLQPISRTADLIQRVKPDVVHTHLLRADLFGGLAAARLGTKLVSTVYAHGRYRRSARRPIIDGLLDRFTYSRQDRIIAVCDAIKDDLVDRLGIAAERVTVIHTGIDLMQIGSDTLAATVRKHQLPSDRPIVVVPARLSYEKGVDCFIRAVRICVDRGKRACFVIVGSGPLRRKLINLASRLGLSDDIRFLGFVEDIEPVLAASDLIVLPSYCEGLPNAALEALAVGRPLVASAVGGIVDLCGYDGQAIMTAQPNDPADLADKIITALTNSKLTDAMARAGQRIITEHLSTERVAQRYERLYLQL